MLEKTGDVNTPLEKYTNTFCDLALEMDEKTLEKEVAEIRGPLYAHGWQMMLRQLVVVGEHGSGRQEAGPPMDNLRTVFSWLKMHTTVFAVMQFGSPKAVPRWNESVCASF